MINNGLQFTVNNGVKFLGSSRDANGQKKRDNPGFGFEEAPCLLSEEVFGTSIIVTMKAWGVCVCVGPIAHVHSTLYLHRPTVGIWKSI